MLERVHLQSLLFFHWNSLQETRMPCTYAAKIDNAEKRVCKYVLKKINFFYLVCGVVHVEACYKCDRLVSSS